MLDFIFFLFFNTMQDVFARSRYSEYVISLSHRTSYFAPHNCTYSHDDIISKYIFLPFYVLFYCLSMELNVCIGLWESVRSSKRKTLMILCISREFSFLHTCSVSVTNPNWFAWISIVRCRISSIKTQEITYEREKLPGKPGMNRLVFNLHSMSIYGKENSARIA